ncbi:hypothetical protein L227DRAFT_402877 [Lentinus tigrinus ALCF2SS1-6]|uniref:Uncharacterized protein n=1 Tax=Lentinus tigrinus ALCF2SS1-6 TaxID=1328759 RepID=A0A5C2RNT8_9APHY|nr:hypothetical protein L227DRAFT_402877 [Lentinus tigrinus ALCF2SS1-6]
MLHRPGSACSGLPELTSLCEAWTSVVEPMSLPGARYTVDLSEDLLVISRLSDDQTEYHHHFFSISSDCYPHPFAASPVLRALRSTRNGRVFRCPKEADRLDILSDLVAWGSFQDTCGDENTKWQVAMEVHVMNWKTGAVVWRYTGGQVSFYHLIDRHHVLVTQRDGIHVFAFDPDRGALEPPAHTTIQTQLLHLRLPGFEPEQEHLNPVKSFLHIPRTHRDDRPLFRPDPSHSLLAIHMDHMHSIGPGREKIHSLVFLVSLMTIRGCLARWQTGWWRSLVLPWDDWGPTGARIIALKNIDKFDLSLAMHGSRCMLKIPTPCNTNLVVIDAHPWVRHCGHDVARQISWPHYDANMAVECSDVQSFVILGHYRLRPQVFRYETMVLEGTFPCHMAWFPVSHPAHYRGNHTVLTSHQVFVVASPLTRCITTPWLTQRFQRTREA